MHLSASDIERAKELLENGFIDEAVKEIEQRIFSEWQRAVSEKEREQLWHEQRLSSRFKDRLLSVVNDDAFKQHLLRKRDRT